MKSFNPYILYKGAFIPNGVLSYPDLSSSSKLCYGRLLQYAGKDGKCFPRQQTLARELSLSLVQVRRVLAELEEKGFIYRDTPPPLERFHRRATTYGFLKHRCLITPAISSDSRQNLKKYPAITTDRYISNNKLLDIKDKDSKESLSTHNILSEDKSSSRITVPGNGTGKLHRRTSSQIIRSQKSSLLPKKKEPVSLRVPAKVRSVMKYWEGKGLHVLKEETKSFRYAVERIKGLFQGSAFYKTEFDEYAGHRFTIGEIRKAIDRFAIAALDPHYLPTMQFKRRLKGLNIGAFIYSPFTNNGIGRSHFIHYLEKEPVLAGTPVVKLEDNHSVLTEALKKRYRREVLGGAEGKMSVMDENHFVRSAEKLVKFLKQNKSRIRWHQELTPAVLADWMMEAVKQDAEGRFNITPGWFSSDTMFNRRLPSYLHSQALLEEKEEEQRQYEGTRVGFLH